MLQEIITYTIIGAAITLAILKMTKRFSKKKPAKVEYKKVQISSEHNCNECAAECMLRDAPKRIIEASDTKCNTEVSSSE